MSPTLVFKSKARTHSFRPLSSAGAKNRPWSGDMRAGLAFSRPRMRIRDTNSPSLLFLYFGRRPFLEPSLGHVVDDGFSSDWTLKVVAGAKVRTR